MNQVILRGYVGTDPKITTFQDGASKVAEFSLSTTERGYKTKDGREIPEVTDWHNIAIRSTSLANIVEKYVKKGSNLLIVGKLKVRSYNDKNNIKRYITEVVAEDVELLGGKDKSVPF